MALQIEWTPNALQDYEQFVNYLLKEWPINNATEFISLVEERVYNLSLFPNIGIASIKKPSIRSILITKHNRLFYHVHLTKIIILDIFDTRQDPQKNKHR
jgi:plasmid stabilization system protein ParE